MAFFLDTLGFRVESVFPADAPRVAVIHRHGLQLRLVRQADEGAPMEATPAGRLPDLQPSFVVSRANDGAEWHTGRAGMLYRDLIPDRQGGHFIASHIRIPEGGTVPDYVHFHRVRFQMIYCLAGWVRVVYEDQGPPFVMHAGDCVLQPPEIRHRVLECSPGLEVLEIGCPAEHETRADHDLCLPNSSLEPERDFGGQRFVLHQAAKATWQSWRLAGFRSRDTGIAAATDGLARVEVVRIDTASEAPASQALTPSHGAAFLFLFVLTGTVTLRREEHGVTRLSVGDACVLPPAGRPFLEDASSDLELVEVALPAFR